MSVKGLSGAEEGLMLVIRVLQCSQEREFTQGIMLKGFSLFLHSYFGRLRLCLLIYHIFL